MDNFKAVYAILSVLEKSMDYPEADLMGLIGPDALKVSEERWARYIEMMIDEGYVKGAMVKHTMIGSTQVDIENMRITLKGLEYLHENSTMQKVYKAVKGIKEVIPIPGV